ncbi:hypothetical protein RIF29_39017 [Crotalaria pallida]|uniref:DUF4283 domain-containing protein n=1 Tax=Crotalaria pallida TaxID=3830 RepID=A0AAN9HP96_CROPI
MNGMIFKGNALFVKKARFVKEKELDNKDKKDRESKRWPEKHNRRNANDPAGTRTAKNSVRDERTYVEALTKGRRSAEKETPRGDDGNNNYKEEELINMDHQLKRVIGRVCVENLLWLRRSMVLTTYYPTGTHELHEMMRKHGLEVTSIRRMRSFKFLATLRNGEALEEAIVHLSAGMEKVVHAAKKWATSDLCDRRRVSVEFLGIPPHAWCKENVAIIVEGLGLIEKYDQSVEEGSSMESIKVLIHTKYMPFIEDRMVLSVENEDFEIFVREIDRDGDWKPIITEDEGSSRQPDVSRVMETTRIEMQDDKSVEVVENSKNSKDTNDSCSSQKTKSAGIDYNMEEELALIYQCYNSEDVARPNLHEEDQRGPGNFNSENEAFGIDVGLVNLRDDGPPGFNDLNGLVISKVQNIIAYEDKAEEARKSAGPCKTAPRGRLSKRASHTKQKQKYQCPNSKKPNESYDDNLSNDELEAQRTWEVGKQLDLKTSDERRACDRIVMLRRSARRLERQEGAAPSCNTP